MALQCNHQKLQQQDAFQQVTLARSIDRAPQLGHTCVDRPPWLALVTPPKKTSHSAFQRPSLRTLRREGPEKQKKISGFGTTGFSTSKDLSALAQELDRPISRNQPLLKPQSDPLRNWVQHRCGPGAPGSWSGRGPHRRCRRPAKRWSPGPRGPAASSKRPRPLLLCGMRSDVA